MPYYKWNGTGEFRDSRNNRTIAEGEVVELDEKIVGGHDFEEVDEPPGETETPDVDEPDEITCAEGDCSRSVDEVGEFCWQHSTDE
jgi:hypothetical protein